MEVLARVRGELPGWCAWDAGMVPLSSRETAKGEEQAAQLAALRQVLPVLQRSHPRAKRKPDPRIKALQPGSSPLGCGRDCARAGMWQNLRFPLDVHGKTLYYD